MGKRTGSPTQWFFVDAQTGELARAKDKFDKAALKSKAVRTSERFLESLVVLNPEIIGAGGHLPLVVHGGQSSADQIYCDEFGRSLVAEFKVHGNRDAALQLLGYGHHVSFEPALEETDDRHLGVDVVHVTRPKLRALACSAIDKDNEDTRNAAIAKIDAKLSADVTVAKLGRDARKRLRLSAEGTARVANCVQDPALKTTPRMVLVATGFTEDCIELVAELNAHWIDMSLVQVQVFDTGKAVLVAVEKLQDVPAVAVMRDAIGRLWADPVIRTRFIPGGWYFSRRKGVASFSFSGSGPDSAATFWLDVDPRGTVTLATRVPHSSFDARARKQLDAALRRELPARAKRNGSDWAWTFARVDDCFEHAVKVARASDAILGTAFKDRR